jgi:hypothetical protein
MALRAENRPSYEFDALATLRDRNVRMLAFWCVRNARRCVNRHILPIEDAIQRFGPATSLVMLARRARCLQCGALGCHVQPDRPPVQDGGIMAVIDARGGYWL